MGLGHDSCGFKFPCSPAARARSTPSVPRTARWPLVQTLGVDPAPRSIDYGFTGRIHFSLSSPRPPAPGPSCLNREAGDRLSSRPLPLLFDRHYSPGPGSRPKLSLSLPRRYHPSHGLGWTTGATVTAAPLPSQSESDPRRIRISWPNIRIVTRVQDLRRPGLDVLRHSGGSE